MTIAVNLIQLVALGQGATKNLGAKSLLELPRENEVIYWYEGGVKRFYRVALVAYTPDRVPDLYVVEITKQDFIKTLESKYLDCPIKLT